MIISIKEIKPQNNDDDSHVQFNKQWWFGISQVKNQPEGTPWSLVLKKPNLVPRVFSAFQNDSGCRDDPVGTGTTLLGVLSLAGSENLVVVIVV